MAELWTPDNVSKGSGQGNQGGIELPESVRRKREEAARQAQAEAEAQRPSQTRRGSGPELAFPPAGVEVTCPSCGNRFVAPVFSIIDLGLNPELREPLLAGQINVAICSRCGAGGMLSAPLLIHDPEHEFLAAFIPPEAKVDDIQAQKIIGEMTQALMQKLPPERRRGYLLQPKQFMTWDSLMEKLWEFEGVTPEMLRRQQEQVEFLNSLIRLADDPKALEMALERRKSLVDDAFFALLGQLLQAYLARGDEKTADALMKVREYLVEHTEAGQEVKAREERLRQALARLRPEMTREDVLDLLLEYWRQGEEGEQIAQALMVMVPDLVDYEMLLALSNRLEQTQDVEERGALVRLRELMTEIYQAQSQVQQSQEAQIQRAQAFLTEVLQAPDPVAKLREHSDQVDELFLSLLANSLQQVRQNRASYAAKRLQQIYDAAMEIYTEGLPEDVRLLNQLMQAKDASQRRRLLKEHRGQITPEFLDTLRHLEEDLRSRGEQELAERVKTIRGEAALMV